MSIEARAMLMKNIELGFASEVPAAVMQKLLSIVSVKLSDFDVTLLNRHTDGESELLKAYLAAMRVQGRSGQTIDRYHNEIRRMLESVGIPTQSVTVYHLRQYLSDEKERGLADRTLEGKRQIFSAFFNWLARERLIDANPTANLGAIKVPKTVRPIFSDAEIERLKYGAHSVRDRAIISFLSCTGCRISEVVRLNRNDLSLDAQECIVFGKGKKQRVIFFDGATAMLIGDYLHERTDTSPALFAGRGTERITPCGIRYMLKTLAAELGMKDVHPHKFRRTFATNTLRHGAALQDVAAMLGHDKLDTTMGYVVLDTTEVKNSYHKFA